MINPKKILIFFLAVVLFVSLAAFVFARDTEITYPQIDGVIVPTKTTDLLPDYVKYVFTFAIMISAVFAFGSFLYGGFRWLMSAGSSSVLSDAKDRIKAGALGLVVILSSYLILTTINPQLVNISPATPVRWGIVLYTDENCSANPKEITRNTVDSSDPDGLARPYLKFNKDVSPGSLDVKINDSIIVNSEKRDCQNIGSATSSVEFIWKLPGVYLTKNDANKTEKLLPGNTATLGDFEDKVKGVRFNNIDNVSFGAVLHEHPYRKGSCEVFLQNDPDLEEGNPIGLKTSSVTVFPWKGTPGPGGVTLFENDNFGGGSWSPPNNVPDVCTKIEGGNWATSIRMSEGYLAAMFEEENCSGKCQVFSGSDSNLRDDEIGRCGCGPFGWGCGDCAKSIKVIPTR